MLRKRKKKYVWEIRNAGWGGHQTSLVLAEGFQPFAVTYSEGNHTIWYRKKVLAA